MATYNGSTTHHYYYAYEIVTVSNSSDTQATVTVKAGGHCTGSTTDTIGQFRLTISATGQTTYYNPSSSGTTNRTLTHGQDTLIATKTFTYTRGTSAASKTISSALYLNLSNGNGGPCTSTASGSVSIAAKPKYTVTYNANGGSSTKTSESVYSGSTGTFPTASQCTRTDYTLLGWATSSTATSASYSPGAATPTITAAKTYYAVWQAKPAITVSFNVNGGGIPANPYTYTSGSNTYYWKVTNNLIYLSTTSSSSGFSKYTKKITQSMTQWDCYNYDSFGLSRTGYHGKSNEEWCLTADGTGLTFSQDTSGGNHWTTLRLNGGNSQPTSDKNVTVYANWEPNWWKFHFDGNGATSGSMSDQTHTYGTALALTLNAFERTDYFFNGWNRQSDGSGTSYSNGQSISGTWTSTNGNTYNLYAQWANQTIVTFNPNGGTLNGNGNWGTDANTTNNHDCTLRYHQSQYYAQGKATRTGYTFAGWNTEADGSGYTIWDSTGACTTNGGYWSGTGSSAKWQGTTTTLTVYAKWTPNTYSISYDLQGGSRSYSNNSTRSANGGQEAVNPTSARWDYPPDYSGVTTTSAWFYVEKPTKTGYTFNGWTVSGMDTNTHHYWYNSANTTSTASSWANTSNAANCTEFYNLRATSGTVSFVANWTPNTWIIHFDGNGATGGSMSDQTHTRGETLALPPNGFTKTGYSFAGWQWTNGSSGTVYTYEDEYEMSGSWAGAYATGLTYTLVAQWEPAGLWVGVSNEWKSVKNIYVRTNDAWKPINNIKIYLSGGWKNIYEAEAAAACTHTNAQTVKLSYCIGEHEFDCCVSEGEYQNWTICPDCGMVYVSATGNPDEYISCDICDTESSWNGYRDTWLPASTFPGITDRTEYTNIYHL